MRSTIYLHAEPWRIAVEVEDIWPDGMLPPELEAEEASASQRPPEEALRQARALSKRLGEIAGFGVSIHLENIAATT